MNFFKRAPLQFTGIPSDSTGIPLDSTGIPLQSTTQACPWRQQIVLFGFFKGSFLTSKSHIQNINFYLNKGKRTNKWKLVFLSWASTLPKRDSLPRNFCKTVIQYFLYLHRSPDREKYLCKISLKQTDFWSRLASGNSYRFPQIHSS